MSDSSKNSPASASKTKDDRTVPVILCVDDEKPALFLRSAVLSGAGYAVLTASNFSEALDLFNKNHVDLVITDHLLIGATGTQLARRLKEIHPEVPIVILSGVVDEPDDMDSAHFFLSKNAGPTEMLSHVARLLKL